VSRPGYVLRDAALGYASRGIPVLPLHYPVAHLRSARAVSDGSVMAPEVWTACSCGDRACGQVGKHPLGSLVPHGLREATTNRARVLAWWTRHPQANIGLATGHRFDVLDVDGPDGKAAIGAFAAEHGLASAGPLVRTGGGGWHYYLTPTGLGNVHPRDLEHVDWRGRGGYVVAPPSRHASGHPYQFLPGRDLDAPLAQVPAALLERLRHRQAERPAAPIVPIALADGPAHPYAHAALAEELARVSTAPVGERNHQLWEAGRNLYNLVAGGALTEQQVQEGLLAAADCCGLLAEEPRQTHRTLASARQVGLAHPRQLPDRASSQRPSPQRDASPAAPAGRDRGEPATEGR
jgi:Bifunctional DNA primase/polymerase, N-terminal